MMVDAAHEIPFLSDQIKIIIGICAKSRHVLTKIAYLLAKLQKIFKIQKQILGIIEKQRRTTKTSFLHATAR
jgi:hypothetical protein